MIIKSIDSNDQLDTFVAEFTNFLTKFPNKGVIGVDGVTQCGKSTIISKALSDAIPAEIISLDSLIKIDKKNIIYASDKLNVIQNTWYIADGILNRKLLTHYGIKPRINIYVKKMANYGWMDQDWLDPIFIKDYGENSFYLSNDIDAQIKLYHNEYKPTENTDYLIEIAENYITKDFLNNI